ncbi:3-hydroxyacyl-CoA dehydrogenase [Burkholderia guangdongensis]|uniref:3-hydroxyacyl-CoA dehydrogenase n=1 Tax=Burkholderia guangdongensis TaxID=1792500 RepID=UPI0015CD0615|nr:3-hydroxyacyl-CoA dehydrogenase [Burkholderia guangdongensis]
MAIDTDALQFWLIFTFPCPGRYEKIFPISARQSPFNSREKRTLSTSSDRIVVLSLGRESRVLSVAPDGSDVKVLIGGLESKPDGVTVDEANGHLYLSFMGAIRDGDDFWATDGHIERTNLDGSDRRVIVPVGTFYTGKQITFDAASGRLYWCDREGLGVLSCRTDGSDLTVHVRTGTTAEHRKEPRRHCVGVTVDRDGGYLYWTQKGKPKGGEGMILRAPLDVVPADPAVRDDIEMLFDGLPEPIDLEWDGESGTLYWTDRGAEPDGNTLNRAKIRDGRAVDHEILLHGLDEGIGLTYDRDRRRVFVSDLGGNLRVVSLDRPGVGEIVFQGQGKLTGIAYLHGD